MLNSHYLLFNFSSPKQLNSFGSTVWGKEIGSNLKYNKFQKGGLLLLGIFNLGWK